MIELSNSTAQTIPVGGTVTFDKVLLHSGCRECHNPMVPNSVKLRGKGIYDIEFHGNITSATAGDVLQLAVAVAESPLPQTAMNATPAAAGTLVNVSAGTYLRNCCCDLDRVSVRNTGTTPVVLAPNSSFRIAHLN